MSPIKPIRGAPRRRKRLRAENPEVRRRLFEAANALIEEQGFPQLRIEELADRAGLSVGTFYLYFDGKNDLFIQLSTEHTQELSQRLLRAYGGEGPVRDRLYRGLLAYLDFVEEHEKSFLYFRDAGSVQTTVGSLTTWTLRSLAGELRPVLEEGMATGELRRTDSELLSQVIIGQMHNLAGYWLDHRDSYPRSTVESFLVELFTLGVLAGRRPD